MCQNFGGIQYKSFSEEYLFCLHSVYRGEQDLLILFFNLFFSLNTDQFHNGISRTVMDCIIMDKADKG